MKVFENLTFEEALQAMRKGYAVNREHWRDHTTPHIEIRKFVVTDEGDEVDPKEIERIICVDRDVVTMNPWTPETEEIRLILHGEDLLAGDWMIYGRAVG